LILLDLNSCPSGRGRQQKLSAGPDLAGIKLADAIDDVSHLFIGEMLMHGEGDQLPALGLGPGVMYSFSQDNHLFLNLYFETLAQNRPEGIKMIFLA
jgi:hypothetical protein